MKLSGKVMLFIVAMFATQQASAQVYINVTAMRITLDSDVGKTSPYVGTVKVGYQLSPGFAAEVQYGTSARDDSLAGGDVEIDKLTAYMLRLGGQTTYNGVRMYLLLGTSKTEVKYTGVTTPGETELKGTTWGIGLEESSQSWRNLIWVLEYVRYADDKDTTVTGIGFGVKYNF